MAKLILADGTVFEGKGFGSDCDSDGEVVFNTGMAGYPESLTDPSYRGQILVFTYPLIGNYGVPSEELNEYGFSKYLESEDIHVRGVICAQVSEDYSHHAAVKSLDTWLKEKGIPAITGIDTRALTKKLREHGVMLGQIIADDSQCKMNNEQLTIEDPNIRNLVAEVSCEEVCVYESPLDSAPTSAKATVGKQDDTKTIVVFDCGIKRNIIRSFLKRGVKVIRVPWDFDLASSDLEYDGVFISNGPGDPKMCEKTIESVKWAIDQDIPTFGICLGNQILALAIGGDTYKLKYGHRGVNQPCIEEGSDQKCIITSQNHGFAVDEKLPEGWDVWFRNANDGTVEGIKHKSGKFFSVQFHPEATPGPEDADYLFDEFLEVVSGVTA
jgi:carbamoyl-phosphate synthase small subunit